MKVVKVKFKKAQEEYFFSSVTAIYSKFSKEDIGAVIGSVYNMTRRAQKYENHKVEISIHPLWMNKRKQQNDSQQ